MSKKLVIKINNLKEQKEFNQPKGKPQMVTIIHWHRIVAVALVLMVVVALLAWLLSSFFYGLIQEPNALPPKVSPPSNIVADHPDIFVQPSEDSELLAPSAITPPGSQNPFDEQTSVTEDEIHPDTQGIVSAEQLVGEVVLHVVDNDIPVILDSHKSRNQGEEKSQPSSASDVKEDVKEVNTLSEEAEQKTKEQANPVEIFSSRVKRAQLTSWVKQKEPVDQLGSEVMMINDQLIRVFLFTELAGLKGKTLYYSWYLNDKRMARVVINIKSDHARVSSSKYIDKYMRGPWKVVVTDNAGEVLVFAGFEVKPSE